MSKYRLAALAAAFAAVAGAVAAEPAVPVAPTQPAATPAPAQPAETGPMRLDETQMDAVSGGLLDNISIVIPINIVNAWSFAYATDGGTAIATSLVNLANTVVVSQKIRKR